MKIIISISVLLLFILQGNCQKNDTILTRSGKTIACKILEVSNDVFVFKTRSKNNWVETSIPKAEILDFKFYFLEEFKHKVDSNNVITITMKDGSSIIGSIQEINAYDIEFRNSTLGMLTIKATQIVDYLINEEGKYDSNEYWFPNPQATRHFFAPTARNLDKGEGYFRIFTFF